MLAILGLLGCNEYIDVSDGTVTDPITGLVWQQAVDPGSYTWEDAKAYCLGLSLAGGGWRLPTITELQSIVDNRFANPAIDPAVFPNTPSGDEGVFWSSSPSVGLSDGALGIAFGGGASINVDTSWPRRVRCVR